MPRSGWKVFLLPLDLAAPDRIALNSCVNAIVHFLSLQTGMRIKPQGTLPFWSVLVRPLGKQEKLWKFPLQLKQYQDGLRDRIKFEQPVSCSLRGVIGTYCIRHVYTVVGLFGALLLLLFHYCSSSCSWSVCLAATATATAVVEGCCSRSTTASTRDGL